MVAKSVLYMGYLQISCFMMNRQISTTGHHGRIIFILIMQKRHHIAIVEMPLHGSDVSAMYVLGLSSRCDNHVARVLLVQHVHISGGEHLGPFPVEHPDVGSRSCTEVATTPRQVPKAAQNTHPLN
jgi:hypothetical protein